MRKIASITAALGLLAGAAYATPTPAADTTAVADEPTAASRNATPLAADAAPVTAEASTAAEGVGNCPVTWRTLRQKLRQAVSQVRGGSNNDMWGVVVNRDGVVCAVAFSGADRFSQWRLSRQIAAAKAFTSNGLSLSNEPFSTAQLLGAVQPGASLYHVEFGNPVDPDAAYKGPVSSYGTQNDPMVGSIVGGTIPFGGGVPLGRGSNIQGALGISGDSACRDDQVARKLRVLLNLKPSGNDGEGLACRGS